MSRVQILNFNWSSSDSLARQQVITVYIYIYIRTASSFVCFAELVSTGLWAIEAEHLVSGPKGQ